MTEHRRHLGKVSLERFLLVLHESLKKTKKIDDRFLTKFFGVNCSGGVDCGCQVLYPWDGEPEIVDPSSKFGVLRCLEAEKSGKMCFLSSFSFNDLEMTLTLFRLGCKTIGFLSRTSPNYPEKEFEQLEIPVQLSRAIQMTFASSRSSKVKVIELMHFFNGDFSQTFIAENISWLSITVFSWETFENVGQTRFDLLWPTWLTHLLEFFRTAGNPPKLHYVRNWASQLPRCGL